MTVTGPLVLKEDIVLIPCAELREDVRERISFDPGDFTLLHRRGRAPMQVIDAGMAALLELFRRPRTIAEAVLENSRAVGQPPEARLEELLPHLEPLLDSGVLVPAGFNEAAIRPRYDSGIAFAGWTIVRCIHLIEDHEIYEAQNGAGTAALKIGRSAAPELQLRFENEAAALRRLHGSAVAPELIGAGERDGRPYLIAEWISGVDAATAAAQRRHDRPALADLCASIAAAYATLHARGVLHGDINWRNVRVGDRLALLDFEGACFAGEPPRIDRMTFAFLIEPECASALRHGDVLPPSEAGEQYLVAALLYLLVTGHQYVDFRYDNDEMLRQIESESPVPFETRGIAPWPEMEEILGRALEKEPSRRYASMSEMAALLAAVRDDAARAALATPLSSEATALLQTTLQSFALGGATLPRASIYRGCAGAAVGLLRIAEVRGEPELLAMAEVWRSRAAALLGTEEAGYEVTPYHTESGVHAAAAMIAAANGDRDAQRLAVAAFLRASRRPCREIDVILGRSGSLLAASMLLAISGDLPDAAALRAFGAETMHGVWHELDERPAIAASPGAPLGMAHGWTGYLYSALRWCAASGDSLPPRLAYRLCEFAGLHVAAGRGICWPSYAGDEPHWPLVASWCNGSAGHLFLFTLAHRILGAAEWLRLAELCAWTTWDGAQGTPDLCCGSAGRAYALLSLYRSTGKAEWLARARQLANHAATMTVAAEQRAALWQGELGVAALIADLTSPENARMPFFE